MGDINAIITAISTVGFPIVCCGALFWQSTQMQKQHKEEMDNVKEALNNNTLALQHLADTIGSEKE